MNPDSCAGSRSVGWGGDVYDDPELRATLKSLKPFLARLGLIPSRLTPFIPETNTEQDSKIAIAYEYLKDSIQEGMEKYEKKDEHQSAVLFFVDKLLDDKAPAAILWCFMHTLFLANSCPETPYEGAWKIHDVLLLANTYLPLQQAILASKKANPKPQYEHSILEQCVAHRLLDSSHMTSVLDAFAEADFESAVVYLLASVFLTIRQLPSNTPGDSALPGWLKDLFQCIEHCGSKDSKNPKDSCPEAMLSPDTWRKVSEKLLSKHSSEESDDFMTEEMQSDAGKSTIDELASVNFNNDDIHCKDSQYAVNKVPDMNMSRSCLTGLEETPEKRTADYISKLPLHPPPFEYIDHGGNGEDRGQQHGFGHYREQDLSSDFDDSSSVSTAIGSTSTENNSHVEDNVVTDMAKTLHFSGLHEQPDNEREINLHKFQEELLHWARQRKNVAIFLPTGTGKTFVVLKYVKELLSQPDEFPRVVFLAPKVKLAEQQYRRFLHFFPEITYLRTGRARSCTGPLSELLSSYQVFVMTPMCLVEAVKRQEVKMTDFSLLVLDECHNTVGKSDFRVLMDLYMDTKFSSSESSMPQVIGLTASPGAGRGDSLERAVTHIRDLCFSMDIEKISTVKQNIKELENFMNDPKHEIHTCKERSKNGFKKIIEKMMKTIEDDMISIINKEYQDDIALHEKLRKVLTPPTLRRGTPQYTQWVCGLQSSLLPLVIDNDDAHMPLFSFMEMLWVYQRSLILNEDCESDNALEYLHEQVRDMEEAQSSQPTDLKLLRHFKAHEEQLKRACKDLQDYNPKLHVLEDILLTMIDKNEDRYACMVFVRTIDLSLAIQRWIQNHPRLKILKPGRIIGNRRDGMTQSEMSDILEKFNQGYHQLVVCTSAAEEGLDFQACNVVIRYDYVTSMIAMMQTRGRARKSDSQYRVIGGQMLGNVDRERGNMATERLMNRAIDQLKMDMDENPSVYLNAMKEKQCEAWRKRMLMTEAANRKRRLEEESTQSFQLLCRKCKQYACQSTDIRCLRGTSRLVIAEDFKDRWKKNEKAGKGPECIQYNIEKIAKVHCKECSYEWGCLIRYLPSNAEYPLLKLESFLLKDTHSGKLLVTDRPMKWARCPFSVQQISDEDLANLPFQPDTE